MKIWTGVTDASLTHSLTTLKDSATQLLIKYKSGALVTQCNRKQIQYFPAVDERMTRVSDNSPTDKFAMVEEDELASYQVSKA